MCGDVGWKVALEASWKAALEVGWEMGKDSSAGNMLGGTLAHAEQHGERSNCSTVSKTRLDNCNTFFALLSLRRSGPIDKIDTVRKRN